MPQLETSLQASATPRVAAAASAPRATLADTAAVFGEVFLPTLAEGVILRRRAVMRLAELLDLGRRAVRRMQRVRDQYAPGPLLLRFPGRSIALILDPQRVHRVLDGTPHPFSTASLEKRAALAHFEPRNVLISRGSDRADRRRYHEQVLEAGHPVHRLAGPFLEIVAYEASRLCYDLPRDADLNWDRFAAVWFRVVRRILFGESAAEDHELSITMAALRSAANWAFLRPQRDPLRRHLFSMIRDYLDEAAPASLAGVMAQTPATSRTAPEQQVPQWLFAFDSAGMAAFRALALLAAHRPYAAMVREEIRANQGSARQSLPRMRTAVLESLRLWPTSPLILRETLEPTSWETGLLPANTAVVIFAPFFHRDSERLPYADRFTPDLWMTDRPAVDWPLIPFSEGPAVCPGRHLALLLTSAMLAAILDHVRVRLKHPRSLLADGPLPATLNHFRIRFEVREAPAT